MVLGAIKTFHDVNPQFRLNSEFNKLIISACKTKKYDSESHFIRVAVIEKLRREYPKKCVKIEKKLVTLEYGNMKG